MCRKLIFALVHIISFALLIKIKYVPRESCIESFVLREGVNYSTLFIYGA